ncbi:hypothetical protein MLD38_022882 [Melastoma candidum]|uniref:Uncharacterized protein n=1 Tax=Melastoma candidum TaxID=119954 RepID=A0ACB9QKS5_9MYRT|nr:hypothetical protein MLD38_022882 [Melastoma candidum]
MQQDLEHLLEGQGLGVSILPGKGRCLFAASRDFYPGEVIMRQDPYVYVPGNSDGESRCDRCLCSGKLSKCSACQVAWYCGSSCQKSDWNMHRLECKALAMVDKDKRKFVTPSLRLMLKLYIRRRLQQDKVIPATVWDNHRLVEALVAHMSELEEKQLVLYAQMANLVNLILQWPDIDIREITESFSKLSCNAHTICDSELRPLGTGLYPVIAIINHSCAPNSVLVFDERTAVVRAVQHISKGSEVFISYIETAASTATRRKALKEQYFFDCLCIRCAKMGTPDDIKESAILEGYRCQDSRCFGFLLRDSENEEFMCQECGQARSKEEMGKIAGEEKDMLEEASTRSNHALSIFKKIENLQEELYHPFSVILLRTREKIIKILMDQEDWTEALGYCRLTISTYERAYPGFHPLLGLQYYTCGKIEWLLGESDDAIKSLSKAVDILRVTHRANSAFVNDLVSRLDEARAEAYYKLSQCT